MSTSVPCFCFPVVPSASTEHEMIQINAQMMVFAILCGESLLFSMLDNKLSRHKIANTIICAKNPKSCEAKPS